MRHRSIRLVMALGLALGSSFSFLAWATVPTLTIARDAAIDRQLVVTKGLPNEEHRLAGLKSYANKDYVDAARRFRLAALHADKPAQHYLSLMHWHGVGVPADRARAYIWADLAAERGTQRLLALRERMWAALSADERARALRDGPTLHDYYGDARGQRRAEAKMRRFARRMTGSRVGYGGQNLSTMTRPVNGTFGAAIGANAAAYSVDEVASARHLYGALGGIARMRTYWRDQDRLFDPSIEIGPFEQIEVTNDLSR